MYQSEGSFFYYFYQVEVK